MAHRRGSFRRGGGISDAQRRKKTWVSLKVATGANTAPESDFMTAIEMETAISGGVFQPSKVAIIAVNDPTAQIGNESSSLGEETTILRTRGSLLFPKSDPAQAASPNLIVQQNAFGIGVTDVRSLVNGVFPGPIVDADWDGWMFLRQSTVTPVDSVGTVIDIKAMRKIESGDALFVAAESISAMAATTAASWVFDLRFLLLLP